MIPHSEVDYGSLQNILAAVKSFSSKELTVKRSTKQNFFEPSVGHGTSLIRQFSQNGALYNENFTCDASEGRHVFLFLCVLGGGMSEMQQENPVPSLIFCFSHLCSDSGQVDK